MPLDSFGDASGAQASDFSIDDYGDGGSIGPFQIMEPSYPTPKWLNQYVYLGKALRECQTLCTLQGRPFRVMTWNREGSGARGNGVPCMACRDANGGGGGRLPRNRSGCGCAGSCARPVAEFQPGGRRIVFDGQGNPKVVGRPDYTISHTPFPRLYNPREATRPYMEAIKTGQILANYSGRRVFLCSGFGANCTSKFGVPVVYVDPGGLVKVHPNRPVGTVLVNPVTPEYFQELVAESRGRSYLGHGA